MAPLDPSLLAHSPRTLANLRIVVGAMMIALAAAGLIFTNNPSPTGLLLTTLAGLLAVVDGIRLRRRLKGQD